MLLDPFKCHVPNLHLYLRVHGLNVEVLTLGIPCLICGLNTESIDGLPSMEEEKQEDENWEELELWPAVLQLLPCGLSAQLVESRNALSSENCTKSKVTTTTCV